MVQDQRYIFRGTAAGFPVRVSRTESFAVCSVIRRSVAELQIALYTTPSCPFLLCTGVVDFRKRHGFITCGRNRFSLVFLFL